MDLMELLERIFAEEEKKVEVPEERPPVVIVINVAAF